MAIIPIINTKDNEKEQIKKLFESSLYFLGFEITRKTSERMYLLITNKSVITKAQKEADNLLIKFCGRRQKYSKPSTSRKKETPLNPQSSIILCSQTISEHLTNPFSSNIILTPVLQKTGINYIHTKSNLK